MPQQLGSSSVERLGGIFRVGFVFFILFVCPVLLPLLLVHG